MEPLVFDPILKRIRWGGTRLGSLLHKPLGPELDYAESWEIADQADGQSRVAGGVFDGLTLRELMSEHKEALLGRHADHQQFPLLIKFLDANDWLSLQVHPDDDQALRYGKSARGKTEAWVILESGPDSRICAGLKSDVTAEHLQGAMHSGSLECCLNMIPVQPGDCVFVPAGTVHALGPGIVLAEIQQQSNVTFRLSDWGRTGHDGQPRPLHPQESLACTDFNRGPISPVEPVSLACGSHVFEELIRCQYFVIRRHISANPFSFTSDDRFRILMVLDGQGILRHERRNISLRAGQTVLLPAACATVRIVPQEGRLTLLDVVHP